MELYEAARKLGVKSDLLSIIGSYGDTLKDQDVLDAFRYWNEVQADLTPPGESVSLPCRKLCCMTPPAAAGHSYYPRGALLPASQ